MRNTRISLVIITSLLLCLGVIMIYSTSSIYAWHKLDDPAYFLKRHIFYIMLGILLALFIMSIDYRILEKYSKTIMFVSLLLLIFVIIPGVGREISGARRWFRLLGFSFQPSEFVQLAMIIYVASFLSRNDKNIKDFYSGFLPVMIILGISTLLILLQPDLGMSVALVVITFFMLFAGGIRLSHLGAIILLSLPVLYLLILRVPYRRLRILSFLNPWGDPKGSGFQLIQSQIALGSGGLLGVGLGQGMQKLFYLPAAHTDFIFSIIGEELGLIGTLSVLILFILFIWQSSKIAMNASDGFGHYLGIGITAMIAFEAIVNIGVSTGTLPTKGLPLPFVSYGGTSLVFDMISVGLLLNISKSKDE
ncbi:MAG: putative lipid II flippase FtsW [Candidatus Omnitrophica bacterium]|nr:putative lipid II flippase FtsW [Candidatus Omnitrophota bacterium]